MESLFEFLADSSVLVLFLLVGLGMALGHIKFKGLSLGAAAVLFTAIGFSAWAQAYDIKIQSPHEIGILGLTIFAFAIGIISGPNFFHVIKTAVGPIITLVAVMIAAGATAYFLGVHVFGMSPALTAGTYAGAITNTPGLAAAGQASGELPTATVGYSIAYLFGVIGMIVASHAALSYGKYDKDKPSPITNRTIRVERNDHPCLGDIFESLGGKVTFSRLRRGESGPISRPTLEDTLDHNDLITVVGPTELVSKVISQLGHGSSPSLSEDRRYLDFRRITVSDPKLAGLSIGELRLSSKFSATVSRVRRGDIDMVGEPGVVLQQGDRVRVVAPTSQMRALTQFFGDSARGLSDINPVALGLGMALGILIGELDIFTPTGAVFSIGSAAGTLIVGLIFGRIGRIGKVVTAMPHTACMVLAELGLLIFLAQAGLNAGTQIANAFTGGDWWKIFIVGAATTSVMALGIYGTMRWMFHMGGTRLAGLLGGAQTQPAVLAFANNRTNGDPRVALGYAMIYPVSMIVKILIAQVLGGM